MNTVNVDLSAQEQLNLLLGRQLENEASEVVFDFSSLNTEFGSGTLTLSVLRPGDTTPYGATLTTSGTDATWSVTSTDTAYAGVGEIQLTYTVGDQVKKTLLYMFTIYPSLGADGEYPSPGQTWQEEIEADIGTLTNLTTSVKTDLVSAINEVDADVTDLKEDVKDNLKIETNIRPELFSGYIFPGDNSIVASDNFSVTAPIAVKKGQLVTLIATGYNTSIGMIATCNADNTVRHTVAVSVDSTERTYYYKVVEDGYIVCSFGTAYNTPYKLSLSIDYYDVYDKVESLGIVFPGSEELLIEKYISGSYVDSSGNVQSSGNFFISQSITLYKGQALVFNARGYNSAVSMISEYDSTENTYTPLVVSIDTTNRTYTYTAEEKKTVRCSANWYGGGAPVPYSASVVTDSLLVKVINDYIDGSNETNALNDINYPQTFSNIICMGDSLTKGYIGNGDTLANHNYPYYFEKLIEAEITNQSQGGITAQDFWSTYADDYDYTPFDCAIIYLGTNGGLTDTVDTECYADYTQNADTNTGCYGKIIGRIKETAPNCKIFVVAGVNDYVRRATTMNPAVRALAEFYEVGLIDVESCIMSDSGGGSTSERYLYRPVDGIHYNSFGYMTMANMFYDSMNKFMSEHRDMFADSY